MNVAESDRQDGVVRTEVAVLVVDDQAAFRSAARSVVTVADGFRVAGEAASAEEALVMVEDLDGPGLVLMDINLGAMSGIAAAREITSRHPDVVVVLMSTYTAEDLPADAGSCGAAGYVHKEDLGPDVLRTFWDGRP